jgi:hypothetical protein
MRTQPAYSVSSVYTDSSSTNLINRSAINILNDLNSSPAVEAISPIRGSRHNHSFYICRLCYPKRTHIMNIGATLHHITQDHISEHHNYRDKLTQEAFDHLTEVRHLLQQSNDRRVFTTIRSSSDSLPIITWRGNSLNSDTTSFNMAEDRVSSIGNPIQQAHFPLATKLPKGPPPQKGTSKLTEFRPRVAWSTQVCPWTCQTFFPHQTTDWDTRKTSLKL